MFLLPFPKQQILDSSNGTESSEFSWECPGKEASGPQPSAGQTQERIE